MPKETSDRIPTHAYVRSLFDGIAPRYDLLNHLLSAGIDRRWRRRAVEQLRDLRPRAILDVATGTGDLALEASRLQPEEIIGVDLSPRMLERARAKVARRGLARLITLQQGEAEALPFGDGRFDGVLVAFGVRNFERLDQGLREIHRVLRPGGKLVVLEFSHPHRFPFRQLYFFYFRRILPRLGRALSGHAEAYSYLPDTVMAFPEGEAFVRILSEAGFERPTLQTLSAGVASIYTGQKAQRSPGEARAPA